MGEIFAPPQPKNVATILPNSPPPTPERKPVSNPGTPVAIDTNSSVRHAVQAGQRFSSTDSKKSRLRNLQRFLTLPQLTVQFLWFPLIKCWVRQVEQGRVLNRQQRRHLRQLKSKQGGFWVIAIDRTQWQQHNVFMASVIWGKHALPLCFEPIDHLGSSDLACQKRLIKQVLRLFKSKKYPVLILGDREFQSPKLADWLDSRDVSFCLRQRKSLHFKTMLESDYETVGSQGFQPGQSRFYTHVFCNKEEHIGPLNLAVYWKRRYRGKGPKEPWYILTNLPTLKQALAMYRARWGIEQMFKDMKTSGYYLEKTKVNDRRFEALLLLIMMAYTTATLYGRRLRDLKVNSYAARVQEYLDEPPRTSDFHVGLYGYAWVFSMALWADFVLPMLALKPHKRLYFQRGFDALSLMKQGL